jgi:hypothetical protein
MSHEDVTRVQPLRGLDLLAALDLDDFPRRDDHLTHVLLLRSPGRSSIFRSSRVFTLFS